MQDVNAKDSNFGFRKRNHNNFLTNNYTQTQQQTLNNRHQQTTTGVKEEGSNLFPEQQQHPTHPVEYNHHYQNQPGAEQGHVEVKVEQTQDQGHVLSSTSYSQDLNSNQTYFNQNPHSCNMCDKGFPTPARLNRHLKTHLTEDEKPYRCEMCEKGFSAKWNLDRHIKESHEGVKRDRPSRKDDPDRPKRPEEFHRCSICEKVFSHRTSLTRHIRSHSDDKPYECDICEKSFVQASDLDRHRRVHTGEKPFQCNQCDRAFTQSANLSRHLKYHDTLKAKKIVYGRDMNLLKEIVDYKKLHDMEKVKNSKEGASSSAGNKKRQKATPDDVIDIDEDADEEEDIMSD